MGTILGSKVTADGKVIYEVLVDYEESLQLKGHFQKIHIFSEDVSTTMANISSRGKNDATKYFLIPKDFRVGVQMKDKVSCQKLSTDSKIIFVYVVDKIRF
jgi:hypothetical protein